MACAAKLTAQAIGLATPRRGGRDPVQHRRRINTAVTRYAIDDTDPMTLAADALRPWFPAVAAAGRRAEEPLAEPAGTGLGVALLGILFFAIFMGLFNLSLRYTSAARGALALSTLPLVTMLAASALRVEPLSGRKSAGVLIAIGGVAATLVAGLTARSAGSVARRRDHGRRDALHGALQYLVATVHRAVQRLGFVTAGMGAVRWSSA